MRKKHGANPTDQAVGARVRAARLELGKSQTWLGKQCGGLTFQQIQKYEKGVNRIGSGRMLQIAKALKKPVSWFYQGSETAVAPGTDLITQMLSTRVGVRLAQNFLAIGSTRRQQALANIASALAA